MFVDTLPRLLSKQAFNYSGVILTNAQANFLGKYLYHNDNYNLAKFIVDNWNDTLEHEFKGNEILTLAAYNAGRGTVKEWMKDNNWDFYFADPALIPFVDTREYVQKVLWDRNRYEELYKNIKPVS